MKGHERALVNTATGVALMPVEERRKATLTDADRDWFAGPFLQAVDSKIDAKIGTLRNELETAGIDLSSPASRKKTATVLGWATDAQEGTDAARKAIVKTAGGAILTGSGFLLWSGWGAVKTFFIGLASATPK